MMVKTPVIQIHRSHHGGAIIRNKGLGVYETGRIFINPDARLQKLGIKGSCNIIYHFFIRNMRQNHRYLHAPPCGVAHGIQKFPVYNKIGRHNVHIFRCALKHGRIYRFCHLWASGGRFSVGYHKTVVNPGTVKHNILQIFVVSFIACFRHVPHLQIHHRKAPDSVAGDFYRHILPVPETFLLIDILIRQIHAARKSHLSVYHHDFSVVTVVLRRG